MVDSLWPDDLGELLLDAGLIDGPKDPVPDDPVAIDEVVGWQAEHAVRPEDRTGDVHPDRVRQAVLGHVVADAVGLLLNVDADEDEPVGPMRLVGRPEDRRFA